jgi:hypothetical protein
LPPKKFIQGGLIFVRHQGLELCERISENMCVMPKLYEYLGLIILFYSNEHEPVHVHGKYQGTESKAEFMIDNGKIVDIRFTSVKGKRPLNSVQLNNFQALVRHYAEDIVQKWIDYFVFHKPVKPVKITRKIQ